MISRSSDPQLLWPKFRDPLLDALALCRSNGLKIEIFEGFRDAARQWELWQQGRGQKGSIVTNAKPYQSAHQYGLAADLCFRGDDGLLTWRGDWPQVTKVLKEAGLEWGGDFKSFPENDHFQLMLGQDPDVLFALYKKDGMPAVWQYMNEKTPMQ